MNQRRSTAPAEIAITGFSCRLPEAAGTDAFWRLLREGRAAISTVRPDRWASQRFVHPDRRMTGRSYTMAAGQIDGIWEFDPGFFGISPREAAQMDPQQRMLLEVAAEALETAGVPLGRGGCGRTGVFVGASAMDHSQRFASDPAAIEQQFMTGNTLSILSNRISYAFDFKGPSYTVDTACSSSFYALHQAVAALAAGEIDTAVVGGVNAILQPFNFVGFSRASMLSPTGLCRAFDAGADGYVRSEGAVVFVLRRVEEARAAGDPVRAVLLGTGINSDGRTVGLSLPSGEHQARLLSDVYGRLGIDHDQIAFIEAHGTGTPVGDPIEAHAIGDVLGKGRARPLPIGSVKSNVGHLEPASGLVGLAKTVLALEHGVFPRTLHVEEINPHIPVEDLGLEIATEEVTIAPRTDGKPWIAGVNSFGFGGANAHAVLRAALPEERAARPPLPVAGAAAPAPLILSAASEKSLAALARAWADRLGETDAADAADLIATAAHRRGRYGHRLVVAADDAESLVEALAHAAEGKADPRAATGMAPPKGGKTAFVFAGNGSQWPGMGRDLYEGDAAFRAAFDHVASLFAARATPGEPAANLVGLLQDPETGERLEESEVAQPLIFAIQVSLVEALAEHGLTPDAVAGHSVGEVAAAWTAGALPLEEAVRLIHVRSRAVSKLAGRGGMAAVLAPAADAVAAIEEMGLSDTLSLAGDNSPRSVTIAGETAALDRFAREARSRRMAVRRLKVAYPYHGPAMEEIREELARGLEGIAPDPATIELVSATTGAAIAGEALDSDYWWKNARQPVLFREALAALSEAGCAVFIEIGPRPVLQSYVTDTLRDLGRPAAALGTIDGPDKPLPVRTMVGRAVAHGARIDDARFFGPARPARHDLPAYPWDHATYRAEMTSDEVDVLGRGADHPLLGWQTRRGEGPWHAQIDAALLPWLADHVVDGAAVMPAAGFIEIALAAGASRLGTRALELSDFDILAPLALEGGLTTVRTEIEGETGIVRIESRAAFSDDDWRLHARGTIRRAPAPLTVADSAEEDATASAASWTGQRLYRLLTEAGLSYGPAFSLVEDLGASGTRATARLAAPPSCGEGQDEHLVLHPASLDAGLHPIFPLVLNALDAQGLRSRDTFIPVRIGRLVTAAACDATPARAEARLARLTEFGAEAEITLFGRDGQATARLEGLRLKRVRLSRRRSDSTIAWGETLVPLPGEGAVLPLPAGWEEPAARLGALGLTLSDADGALAAEPDAGALLIDAAARRIAWDVVSEFTAPDGSLLRIGGPEVHDTARPLHARLVAALEEDGAVTAREGEDRLSLATDCPYPPLGDAVEALIAEAPARAGDLAGLMRLATTLPLRLREGLSEGRPERLGPDHAPARRAIWQSVGQIGADIAGRWPQGRRLSVLVLGDAPPDMIAGLAELSSVTRLTLSDPDRRVTDRLAITAPRHHAVRVTAWDALDGRFDAVLGGDALWRADSGALARLAALMTPGAILAAVEGEGDFFEDMIGGQFEGWWRAALLPEMPLGPRMSGAELAQALNGAGLEQAAALPLGRGETVASILTARRKPVAAAEPAEEPAEADAAEDAPPAPAALLLHAGCPEAAALGAALSGAGWVCREGSLQPDDACDCAGATAILLPPQAEAKGTSDPRIECCRRLVTADRPPAAIWLVTRGGCAMARADAASGARRMSEAAVWGLGRVLANEYPDIAIRQIDIAGDTGPEGLAERLAAAIAAPGDEREIVLDALGAAAPRTIALPDPAVLARRARAGGELGTKLALGREGSLDTLYWAPVTRRAPEAGEVEIAVEATGLNFRDLMWAQRLLPPEALEDGFAGATLGMECAGTVVRVGKGATVEPGTRVLAFAPAAFASHVTVAADVVAPLPDSLPTEAAAGLPAIFLTAQYGLVELAQIAEGETVLIHGAAGGVGLAAIQIARARGARVFATAGRDEKRLLVRLLGADAVFDSRSLAFADEIMRATEGRGVDVVLNSLAGEAMARSIDCLAPFGRFVELGKQDYFANSRLGLRPFRRNLSYFGVDADQLIGARPGLTRRLFAGLMEGFATGSLVPPPVQVFEPGETVEAFRMMQRADHVGKIVIRPARPEPAAEQPAPRAVTGEGTWLIAGGLGGFGLATARWLARQGARRIWLTGRRGVPQDGGETVLAEIAALGCRVECVAVDVSDREAMEMLIARIRAEGRALEGVIHAAMVLDDAPFADLSPERVARVMRPKVEGARLLDRLTRPLKPRHFVLYSSISVSFGNPGQAAYVAANAALEAIAASRRAEGLPGLAIGWGPIADQGYLTRAEETRAFLERKLDGALLKAEDALDGLGAMLEDPSAGPVVRYAPMRWSSLAGDLALIATPLFERVDRTRQAGSASGRDFIAEIAGLDDAAARTRIVEALVGECARILRQPEASIDPHRPLASLGFDSLMAVDLKMSAEEGLGISLPLMSLGDQMSIADLSVKVLEQLRAGETAETEGTGGAEEAALAQLRAQHDGSEVSEEAIEALMDRAKRMGGAS